MLIKTNLFIPKRFQAITYGFLIFIRPEYANDAGLIAHEQVHVKQFWSSPLLFPILYLVSKSHRFQYEVEAYQKQLSYYPNDKTYEFANYLYTNYNLDITLEEAITALDRRKT
jgi:hypothetical protein